MKAASTALKAHLAGGVTTLATCWRIIRLDGPAYAFTSFDQDLVIDGTTYQSTAGFSRSAIATGSTGEVDNLEAVGFFQQDHITEQDMRNGLFDYAQVYVFLVNWANLSQGILRMRRGWLGEVVRSPEGIFQAELRGLTQALVQETGMNYSPICRADLGDDKCKVPIKPGPWAPGFTFLPGAYVQAATQSSDALLQAIFQTTGGGTTGGSEPTWDTTIGNSTVDGGVTWVSKPMWRVLGTVVSQVSQRQFVSSAISFPATPPDVGGLGETAAIGFRANVAAGTIITITDGVHSHSITALADTKVTDAARYVYAWASGFHDWALAIQLIGNNIYLTNSSGVAGHVTKANDTQGAVVIRDFLANPIDGGALTWLSGENSGRSMEVKNVDIASNTVTLWLGMYFPIQVGDRFLVYPGCDKRRDTCYFTYNNILNFRAEPDMPGLDTVLSYPDA